MRRVLAALLVCSMLAACGAQRAPAPRVATVQVGLASTSTRGPTARERRLRSGLIRALAVAERQAIDLERADGDIADLRAQLRAAEQRELALAQEVSAPATDAPPGWVPWAIAGTGLAGAVLGAVLTALLADALRSEEP